MFIIHLVELYRETRDGDNVKTAIAALLNHYYQNLSVSVLYENHKRQRRTVEYGDLEAATCDLKCSIFVLQELYSYYLLLESVFEDNTELLNMAKAEILAERFFESSTLLDPVVYVEKYISLFEIILNKIKQSCF